MNVFVLSVCAIATAVILANVLCDLVWIIYTKGRFRNRITGYGIAGMQLGALSHSQNIAETSDMYLCMQELLLQK